jgi:transposase
MKTAVIGEDHAHIIYNRALIDCAGHYGFHPKACRPYRAKTKGKVECRFATFARTSSSPALSAISTT